MPSKAGFDFHALRPYTGNFRPGTTFEQIVDPYQFDADLRRLVREALDRIEISIRAVITDE